VVAVHRSTGEGDGGAYVTVSFPAFVGVITGVSEGGVGVSEKVWMTYDTPSIQPGSYDGIPDVLALREILANARGKAEAEDYLKGLNRTWSMWVGIGDYVTQSFDLVGYKQDSAVGDSAYSFSLTTFSRTGKLLQIEYALNAVSNGRLSLGIATRDGVVIATDKKVSSPLIDVDNVGKISEIDKGMGFVYSGLGPDARVVVRDARKKAKSYALMYGSPKTVTEAVKSTAS
ncbi:hypothetical protein TrRE_jg5827, partial [Triparma retinervis]